MSRIQLLSEALANQIAAGEVVERPASVIKELVENSLDAGSQWISIDVEQGGLSLMRIRDDGHGILKEDMVLAFSRHATSKIQSFDDLTHIHSLGFRGEALASICSVSRATLQSAVPGASGWQVTAEGTTLSDLIPASHPQGTTIEIRDLFFNTPARRKFLKSEKTELSYIEEMFKRLVLSHFSVGFTLKVDQKTLYSLAPCHTMQDREQRLAEVFGATLIENVMFVENQIAGMRLTGWIGLPTYTRSQSDFQYWYVNHRFIKDKTLNHAVKRAYEDVMFGGRYPVYILYLDIDAETVDVNVHPSKHEVRFREQRLVHDFVYRSLQEAIAQITPAQQAPQFHFASSHASPSYTIPRAAPPMHVQEKMAVYGELHQPKSVPTTALVPGVIPETEMPPLGYALAQLQEIYILAQNAQGLVIIDMHAACERTLYEKLKIEYASSGLHTQPLLIPHAIQVTKSEVMLAEQYAEALRQFGLVVESAGPETILIREVPQLFSAENVEVLLRDLLSDLSEHPDVGRLPARAHEILGNMACRQAVKAHRKLSLMEMNSVLREMEVTPRFGQCNHGRPTWVELSLAELDRYFLRGQ